MYEQLHDLVAASALGRLISDDYFQAYPQECIKLYGHYLNDFVKAVYITDSDKEIKVNICFYIGFFIYYHFSVGVPSN